MGQRRPSWQCLRRSAHEVVLRSAYKPPLADWTG
jgi:hypothetical protein